MVSHAVASCAPRPSELHPAGEGADGVSATGVTLSSPRPPDVLSAGEGVVDVSAAAAALCVKSLRSASSNSYVVSHPADRALWRACTPCTNVGERRSRTSSSQSEPKGGASSPPSSLPKESSSLSPPPSPPPPPLPKESSFPSFGREGEGKGEEEERGGREGGGKR